MPIDYEHNKKIINMIVKSKQAFIAKEKVKLICEDVYLLEMIIEGKKYKIFGVEKDKQYDLNYDILRKAIFNQLLNKTEGFIVEVIGDSAQFSVAGSDFAKQHFAKEMEAFNGILLYGYIGQEDMEKNLVDVNGVVNNYIDNHPSFASMVIANLVDFDTRIALGAVNQKVPTIPGRTGWGASVSSHVHNFFLVWDSNQDGALFGDDSFLSDQLVNHKALLYGGGLQCFDQATNILNSGHQLIGIADLRGRDNPATFIKGEGYNKYVLLFETALFFNMIKELSADEANTKGVLELLIKYVAIEEKPALTETRALLINPFRTDVSLRLGLWHRGWQKFIQHETWRKIRSDSYICCKLSLSSIAELDKRVKKTMKFSDLSCYLQAEVGVLPECLTEELMKKDGEIINFHEEQKKAKHKEGDQDKKVLTYLNLWKSCLEVAQDKLKYYKHCKDVGAISSLEYIFHECERAINNLSEAIHLRKESFRDFKKVGDILNLHEILTECERGINFLSEAIILRKEIDVELPEIQRIKTKVQQVWDEAKQYSMQTKWEAQTTTLIKEELKKFKDQINGRLLINDLQIMISYVDEESKTNKTILMLKLIFETLGISVTSREYQNLTTFEQELKKYTHAIILATPKYRDITAPTKEAGNKLKEVLDHFGGQEIDETNSANANKAKLHVLLCEDDYSTVASQIVEQKYLVRPYQTVFNEKKVWYRLSFIKSIKYDKLQDRTIYFSQENNFLRYQVKNLINRDNPDESDKPILGEITTKELETVSEVIECNKDDLFLEKINRLLPDILKITTQRGHTLKECIADFQEQLPILDFIEHLLNPLSYQYESGMLPSILDITDQTHRGIYEEYKNWFKELKQKQKMLSIKYRLNKILINSIQKDKESLPLTDVDEIKQAKLEQLEKQIKDVIDNLLQSSHLKSNLILCQKGSDQTLVNLLLKSQLILKEDCMVVAIDCGRQYKDDTKTPAYEVNGFLKEKLYLNDNEIEELTKQTTKKVIILFENYERLSVYENLYVKNELSKWLQLKMLITCDKAFFQHRDYASCILPDPSFMDLNSIKCDEIEGVFLDANLRKSSIVDRSMIVSYNFDESWRKENKFARKKRYAQHAELNAFLKNIKHYFQDKIEGIKNAEQIFISYAWEKDPETMMRKQNLLAKIAADLQTLGFFVWLDIERLASNIDQQLDRNILKSRYAFIIGTPSYTKKAYDDKTYVYREFNKIIAEKQQRLEKFDVFHLKFLEGDGVKSFAEQKQLDFKENQVDFCGIDDEEEYIKQLTSFAKGLIPKLMGLHKASQELQEKYIKYYKQMQKQLELLPASHLLVDKGQDDVQSYDIDGRLEVYIEPSGVEKPANTTDIQAQFDLETSLSKFLQNPGLRTYVALGDAGSGKTLFTLWTFKKYVLQPWHNYRNKQLKIYLCFERLEKSKMEINAIYLYLKEYDLCLMSELLDKDSLKDGTIYLEKDDETNKLKYIVKDSQGNKQEAILELYQEGELTKEILNNRKLEILKITSERGHTNLKCDQIQYSCLVKKYKHKSDDYKEDQVITIDDTDSKVYQQIKQQLKSINKIKPQEYNFSSNYECRLMSELVDADKPEAGKIYLEKDDKTNQLKYILKDLQGNKQEALLELYQEEELNKKILNNRKLEILTITSQREHTPIPLYCDKEEFFNLLKPKWLPIYIPLKNYAYPGKNKEGQERKKEDKQTPLSYIEDALLADYNINAQDLLMLKKGLNHEQNILFILDDYNELGKGKNPNFSQALLAGVEDVVLCLNKPQQIKDGLIYIYLNDQNNQKVCLLFKKSDNPDKLIDQDINNKELSKKLKSFIQSSRHLSLLDANLLEEFFKYTYKNHQHDLISHSLRWKYAKIFITGRPEHFDLTNEEKQHLEAFALLEKHNPIVESFEINYMARFTPAEIKDYIDKYKKADPKCAQELSKLEQSHSKTTLTTFEILQSFDNLTVLLQNPFLLNITLQALPILLKKYKDSISRATVYEGFIEYWYTKEIERKNQALRRSDANTKAEETSKDPCYSFAQELVTQMFIHNTISISEKSPQLWKFFNKRENTFVRETCPLRRSGNEYSFIHKSVYEYLLARYLMTTQWLEVQKLTSETQLAINGVQQNYNNSIARLLKKEPSVFSFIQDFAKPYLILDQSTPILISSEDTQTQNLYNIFLELLRWNEYKLALALSDNSEATNHQDNEGLKELSEMFKKLLITEGKAETEMSTDNTVVSLIASYQAWSPPTAAESRWPLVLISYQSPIFKPSSPKIITPIQTTLKVRQFLNLVGWGEQAQAEEQLKQKPELMLQRGYLTDCSGRSWENITALQYAVLALDYHMWTMLSKYISEDVAREQLSDARVVHRLFSTEYPDAKQDAREQIKRLEEVAKLNFEISWKITSSTINWPSLVWQPLIKALDEYIRNYNAWDDTQCTNHWCQQVGGAQLILPAHVINEYSHPDRPNGFSMCKSGFWNGKDKDANLPRSGVADWINNSFYKLGSQFAWLRADCAGGPARLYHINTFPRHYPKIDLAAVTELLRSRTEQAQSLVLQLNRNLSPYTVLALR